MKTNEAFVSELLNRAERSKPRQFRLILSWKDYMYYRKLRHSYVLLIGSLRKSADNVFNRYCKTVTAGNSDVLVLIAYCSVKKVLSFYEEELKVITDMLYEYECYLASGNWLDFIFALPRATDKLWDHRR